MQVPRGPRGAALIRQRDQAAGTACAMGCLHSKRQKVDFSVVIEDSSGVQGDPSAHRVTESVLNPLAVPEAAVVTQWLEVRGLAHHTAALCGAFTAAGWPPSEWVAELQVMSVAEVEELLALFAPGTTENLAHHSAERGAAKISDGAENAWTQQAASCHDVVFSGEGKMGVVFPTGVVPLVVSRIQKQGLAASMPEVQPGMQLAAVQGEAVAALSYPEVIDRIRGAGRPMTLSFLPDLQPVATQKTHQPEPEPEPEPELKISGPVPVLRSNSWDDEPDLNPKSRPLHDNPRHVGLAMQKNKPLVKVKAVDPEAVKEKSCLVKLLQDILAEERVLRRQLSDPALSGPDHEELSASLEELMVENEDVQERIGDHLASHPEIAMTSSSDSQMTSSWDTTPSMQSFDEEQQLTDSDESDYNDDSDAEDLLAWKDVVFSGKGKLGVVFPTGAVPLVIARIQKQGLAATMPELQPGMQLAAVQGEAVAALSYPEIIDLIKAAGRPLTLSFLNSDQELEPVKPKAQSPKPVHNPVGFMEEDPDSEEPSMTFAGDTGRGDIDQQFEQAFASARSDVVRIAAFEVEDSPYDQLAAELDAGAPLASDDPDDHFYVLAARSSGSDEEEEEEQAVDPTAFFDDESEEDEEVDGVDDSDDDYNASEDGKIMFRCPQDAGAGDVIKLPYEGSIVELIVPDGIGPGGRFSFDDAEVIDVHPEEEDGDATTSSDDEGIGSLAAADRLLAEDSDGSDDDSESDEEKSTQHWQRPEPPGRFEAGYVSPPDPPTLVDSEDEEEEAKDPIADTDEDSDEDAVAQMLAEEEESEVEEDSEAEEDPEVEEPEPEPEPEPPIRSAFKSVFEDSSDEDEDGEDSEAEEDSSSGEEEGFVVAASPSDPAPAPADSDDSDDDSDENGPPARRRPTSSSDDDEDSLLDGLDDLDELSGGDDDEEDADDERLRKLRLMEMSADASDADDDEDDRRPTPLLRDSSDEEEGEDLELQYTSDEEENSPPARRRPTSSEDEDEDDDSPPALRRPVHVGSSDDDDDDNEEETRRSDAEDSDDSDGDGGIGSVSVASRLFASDDDDSSDEDEDEETRRLEAEIAAMEAEEDSDDSGDDGGSDDGDEDSDDSAAPDAAPAVAAMTTMTEVVVEYPAGCVAGQVLTVEVQGKEVQIVIPEGAVPGGLVTIEVELATPKPQKLRTQASIDSSFRHTLGKFTSLNLPDHGDSDESDDELPEFSMGALREPGGLGGTRDRERRDGSPEPVAASMGSVFAPVTKKSRKAAEAKSKA